MPVNPPTAAADPNLASSSSCSVAIVGAGFAGLQAATTLVTAGITDIAILEASSSIGGRVRSIPGLAPWPVEAGAEFVHGGNRALRRLLARAGCRLTEYAWPDRWWFDGEGKGLVREGKDGRAAWCCFGLPAISDPDLAAVHALFAGVGAEPDLPPDTPDPSARDWLTVTHGASARQVSIAEACYANDFGADLDALGRGELVTENRLWDAGESYLVSDRPLACVVEYMAKGLPAGCVRTGWPVAGVRVEGEGEDGSVPSVVLTGPGGATLRASVVIIAVPLGVLQAGCITFDPPLPATKRDAMGRLRVGRAMKVILCFRTRFWPPDFFDAVCPGGFVPEFWTVDGSKTQKDGRSAAPDFGAAAVMTGFLAGRFAAAAAAAGEEETVRRALRQLDAMFGGADNPSPASDAFLRAHVADWGLDPHALGGYSIPSRGALPGDRAALAAPAAGGALLFAGEATHPAVNPCVQAALETGERAGKEAAVRVRASRLAGRPRRWGRA